MRVLGIRKSLLILTFLAIIAILATGCGGESEKGKAVADTPEQYKLQCKSIPYSQLVRNPENYKGINLTYSGKVLQVQEKGTEIEIRMDINKVAGDTVWVNYTRPSGENRILEGDIIEFWGSVKGLKSYTTTSGNQVAVPELDAKYIAMVPQTAKPSSQQSSVPTTSSSVTQHDFLPEFRNFVQSKDRINTGIVNLAGKINGRINTGIGIRSAYDLKGEANRLLNEAQANYNGLSNQSYPPEYSSAKGLLIQLFQLEITRARSLYNGLVEASNGSDYSSSFGVGTRAAYKYDEIESLFLNEYTILQNR